METRASYILVGAFVLGLVAVLAGVGIWVARIEFDKTPTSYVIYFEGNVTGLGIGSPARYRGIPVGSVTNIDIDPENVERVRVIIAVSPETPIKQDTVATLALQGITGVAFVQLTGGTQKAPALKPPAKGKLPVISSKPSALQQVMDRLPQAIEKIVIITERATKLFAEENLEAITATLQSLRKTMDALGAEDGDLRRLLRESRGAVAELQSALSEGGALAAKLNRRIDPLADSSLQAITDLQITMSDARGAITTANDILKDVRSVIGDNKVPLQEFAQSGLYEMSLFVSEARVLVDSLTRLVDRIERDPGQFLFGDAQEGVKAQ